MAGRFYGKKHPEMINLRVMRARRGLSLKELGELSGVNCGMISQYERGFYKPHAVTLAKLAKALGCDVADIIEKEEA